MLDSHGFPASHGWLLEGKKYFANQKYENRTTHWEHSELLFAMKNESCELDYQNEGYIFSTIKHIYIYSYLYNFQEWGIEPPKNVTWLWGFISVHKRELIRHYFGEIDLLGVIISWKGMLLSWASVLVGQVFLHNKQPKVVGAWNGKILHVNNSKWWES